MSDTAEAFVVEQEEIQTDLQQLFRGAVKLALEAMLEEVVREMVGVGRWARTGHRKDHRNGTYLRGLLTSLGYVEIAVPRTRNQGAPTDVIGRYKRRATELDDAIVASYVHGVSTRKVGEVTEALLGERVGRSSVSRVTKRLDEAVAELRQTPIEGPIPYLYLDATFLDARWARRVENVSALVAYGVGPDGKRTLLTVTIGAQESEESWSDLLRQLLDRGLTGGAPGHRRRARRARRRRAHAPAGGRAPALHRHLQRNVLAKIPHRLRKRIARAVAGVFGADSPRGGGRPKQCCSPRGSRRLPQRTCWHVGREMTRAGSPDEGKSVRHLTDELTARDFEGTTHTPTETVPTSTRPGSTRWTGSSQSPSPRRTPWRSSGYVLRKSARADVAT